MIYFKDIPKYHKNGRRKRLDERYGDYMTQFRYKCKCGHTLTLRPNQDKKLCNFCGEYFYKDKKLEFKEKLKNELRK